MSIADDIIRKYKEDPERYSGVSVADKIINKYRINHPDEKQKKLNEINANILKYKEEEQKAKDRVAMWESIKNIPKQIYQAGKETLAGVADIATRFSPIEPVRNISSAIGEAINPENQGSSVLENLNKGFQESRGRKTYFEAAADKSLTNEDGSIDWNVGRQFIGRAMEAPTYVYAGVTQPAKLVGQNLLKRVALRTVSALPEAGVNTALQSFEEGSVKNAPVNFLANALLMSGISNAAGEWQISNVLSKNTIEGIEKEIGKLTPEQRIDVNEALQQGVEPQKIIENVKRVKSGELTKEDIAKEIEKQVSVREQATKTPSEDPTSPQEDVSAEKGTQTPKTPESPLIQEAKTLYHGTAEDGLTKLKAGEEGNLGKGIYLSDNPEMAKQYGNMAASSKQAKSGDFTGPLKKGNVLDVEVSKDAKIKELNYQPSKAEVENIKTQGFDGISYPDEAGASLAQKGAKANTRAVFMFNEDKVNIKNPLISEAKKYKSAEEFAKKAKFRVKLSELTPTEGHTPEAMKGRLPAKGYEKEPIRIEVGKDGKLHIQDGNRRYYQALERGDKDIEVVFNDQAPMFNFEGEMDRITNIWNQANKEVKPQKPTELKYESTIKESGLARSVKNKAIKDKMIYGFDKDFRNLPDYDKRIKKEDMAKVTDHVLNDPDEAIKIAMGEKRAPEGRLPEDYYVAVNHYATATKNVDLIRRLATESKLVGEATEMGQRIQALSQLNPDSALSKLKEIKKARQVKAEKVGYEAKSKKIREITKAEPSKTYLPKEINSFDKFLDKITC